MISVHDTSIKMLKADILEVWALLIPSNLYTGFFYVIGMLFLWRVVVVIRMHLNRPVSESMPSMLLPLNDQ